MQWMDDYLLGGHPKNKGQAPCRAEMVTEEWGWGMNSFGGRGDRRKAAEYRLQGVLCVEPTPHCPPTLKWGIEPETPSPHEGTTKQCGVAGSIHRSDRPRKQLRKKSLGRNRRTNAYIPLGTNLKVVGLCAGGAEQCRPGWMDIHIDFATEKKDTRTKKMMSGSGAVMPKGTAQQTKINNSPPDFFPFMQH